MNDFGPRFRKFFERISGTKRDSQHGCEPSVVESVPDRVRNVLSGIDFTSAGAWLVESNPVPNGASGEKGGWKRLGEAVRCAMAEAEAAGGGSGSIGGGYGRSSGRSGGSSSGSSSSSSSNSSSSSSGDLTKTRAFFMAGSMGDLKSKFVEQMELAITGQGHRRPPAAGGGGRGGGGGGGGGGASSSSSSSAASSYTMVGGKHKGAKLCDVPDSYLNWLVKEEVYKKRKGMRAGERYNILQPFTLNG